MSRGSAERSAVPSTDASGGARTGHPSRDVSVPTRSSAGLPAPSVRIGLFSVATLSAIGGFALLGGASAVLVGLLALGIGSALPSRILIALTCLARRRRPVAAGPDVPLRALQRRLDDLADRAGRRSPRLVVVTGEDANAFAMASARRDIVFATRALVDRPPAELDAVLAHELAHLGRRDPLLVASLTAGPAVLVAVALAAAVDDPALGARLARYDTHAEMLPHLSLVLAVALAGIGLGLRQRLEWSADAGAAALLGDSRPVVRALGARHAQLPPGHDRQALLARMARFRRTTDEDGSTPDAESSPDGGIRARAIVRLTDEEGHEP